MEVTDNQNVKSKRDQYLESLKGRYPDKEYATDEDLYGQAIEDNENNGKRIKEYEDREKGLSDMFAKDPRVPRFFSAVRSGQSPELMLVKMYGKDFMDAADDPAKLEELNKANQEYLDRVASDEKLQKEYDSNIGQSLDGLAASGMDDDSIDKALEYMAQMATNFVKGIIKVEDVKMVDKAINFDTAVADAAKEGEVKGRNQRIVEKLRTKKAGDGLPNMEGGSGSMTPSKAPVMPDMGVLNDYGDNAEPDMFARGGYKKIRKS